MKKYTVKLSDNIIGVCEGEKFGDVISTGCHKIQCLELTDLECKDCIITPCKYDYPIELFEEIKGAKDNE